MRGGITEGQDRVIGRTEDDEIPRRVVRCPMDHVLNGSHIVMDGVAAESNGAGVL